MKKFICQFAFLPLMTVGGCQSMQEPSTLDWPTIHRSAELRASLHEQRHVVFFDVDADMLDSSERDSLLAFARGLSAGATIRVRVDGHADKTGTDEYNQDLSDRRASHVASFLSSLGFVDVQMDIEGFGEAAPVALGSSAASLAKNRRVEVIAQAATVRLDGCSKPAGFAADPSNSPNPALGCANLANLAAMIDRPAELLSSAQAKGDNLAAPDPSDQFNALERYRTNELPELPQNGG